MNCSDFEFAVYAICLFAVATPKYFIINEGFY